MTLLFGFAVPADQGIVGVSAMLNDDQGSMEISLRVDNNDPNVISLGPPHNSDLVIPVFDVADGLIS